jgi:hypothetical protein
MVAGGILGDEADQGVAAHLDDPMRIEELGQNRQRQPRHGVGQDRLEGGAGPADQIQDAPARGADLLLIAVALFGQALQGVVIGAGDMHRIEYTRTEAR